MDCRPRGRRPAVRDRLGWYKGEGTRGNGGCLPRPGRPGICAGLDPTGVARALAERGMLRRQDKKNLTCVVSQSVAGTRRCYVLTAGILGGDADLVTRTRQKTPRKAYEREYRSLGSLSFRKSWRLGRS